LNHRLTEDNVSPTAERICVVSLDAEAIQCSPKTIYAALHFLQALQTRKQQDCFYRWAFA